jgi:DNA-binding MarR family transcriptional regulator
MLARNPGVTQRLIAEALEVREITAGRLIDRLCEAGYLKREEHPSDRRAYCLYLAPAAQPVLDKLDELAKIHEAKIFAGFKTEDLDKLNELLDTISGNLSDSGKYTCARRTGGADENDEEGLAATQWVQVLSFYGGRSGYLVPDSMFPYRYGGAIETDALHLQILAPDGTTTIGKLTLTIKAGVLTGQGTLHDIAVTITGRRPPDQPSEMLKNLTVKLAPMLGCVSVAPYLDESYSTSHLGPYGGNIDYNQIREGATV